MRHSVPIFDRELTGQSTVNGEEKGERKLVTRAEVKEMMAKVHKGDQSPFANVQKELKNLAERQLKIAEVTGNIAKGKSEIGKK